MPTHHVTKEHIALAQLALTKLLTDGDVQAAKFVIDIKNKKEIPQHPNTSLGAKKMRAETKKIELDIKIKEEIIPKITWLYSVFREEERNRPENQKIIRAGLDYAQQLINGDIDFSSMDRLLK